MQRKSDVAAMLRWMSRYLDDNQDFTPAPLRGNSARTVLMLDNFTGSDASINACFSSGVHVDQTDEELIALVERCLEAMREALPDICARYDFRVISIEFDADRECHFARDHPGRQVPVGSQASTGSQALPLR